MQYVLEMVGAELLNVPGMNQNVMETAISEAVDKLIAEK